MRSKADETFVIVETLICTLQIIQHYFYLLKHVVAFLVIKFLCQKQRQNFKFFMSKSGCPSNHRSKSIEI